MATAGLFLELAKGADCEVAKLFKAQMDRGAVCQN